MVFNAISDRKTHEGMDLKQADIKICVYKYLINYHFFALIARSRKMHDLIQIYDRGNASVNTP